MLINRTNFLEKCDKWRQRVTEDDLLTDIYDGRLWNDFQMYAGKEFLAHPNYLAVGLGCDWFQPYKHVTYSIGVLYLVIFNLPREERFKMENIILLGIIPGPSEPKKTINSYLGPFVRDMGRGKTLARVFSNILNYSDGFSLCHVRYSCCKKGVWFCWA